MFSHVRNNKGSVVMMVAVSMIVLLGFAALVIDVGAWYNGRVQLSNLADAAAFAGAKDLPDTVAAEGTARTYAAISPPGRTGDVITVDAQTDHITVDATRIAPTYFAQVLGINNVTITAHARVNIGVAGSVKNLIPLGYVDKPTGGLQRDQVVTLKVSPNNQVAGNFHALNFPDPAINITYPNIDSMYGKGGGAMKFEDYIINGYSAMIDNGVTLWTKTGIMAGPTKAAIETRIGDIVVIPLIETFDDSKGTSVAVKVVGFAAFQVIGVSANKEVTGKFVEYITSNAAGGNGAPNNGLYYMKLVE